MATNQAGNVLHVDTWMCPFCRQSVRLGAYGFCTSAEFRDRCLLREHIVEDECLAFRDLGKAENLWRHRH